MMTESEQAPAPRRWALEGAEDGPSIGRRLLGMMWRMRAFEEEVSRLTVAAEVVGIVHVSSGQEAVAAGVCAHLEDRDLLYSGHRAHGHFLAKGADPNRLMAELMGRASGLCGGKGGTMHVVQKERGLLGATGIVGGNLPLAVGTALAAHAAGDGRVTVAFFGDGAVQTGLFHESLNLASLWQLPVLFVCENNGYAEFTPRSVHTRVKDVCDLAAPYGIRAAKIDGNDILATYASAGEFVASVRAGEGPALLECTTYRMRGHYEGDPTAYRTPEELVEWQQKDPIRRLEAIGLRSGWWTDADARRAEEDARAQAAAATRFATASPWPDPSALGSQVYA